MKFVSRFFSIGILRTCTFIILLLISIGNVYADLPKFTLFFDNMMAMNYGPWSYDLDTPGYTHGDQNPYSYNQEIQAWWHVYAYQSFGVGGTTSMTCTQEDLSFVNNPASIEVFDYDSFILHSYDKLNTVVPIGNWMTWGQAGDHRIYQSSFHNLTAGFGNGLFLKNLQIEVIVPWQTQAQMRANLTALGWPWNVGANNWTGDLGTGGAVIGYGLADIDINNTSAQWLAEIDNGSHQLEFTITTFNFQIQGSTGYYDLVIEVRPARHVVDHDFRQVNLGNPFPQEIIFPNAGVVLDVSNAVGGGPDLSSNVINVNQHLQPPDGLPPLGIDSFFDVFWDIGTTVDEINTSIVFDLTGFAIGDPSLWRICRQADYNSTWEIWNDFTLIDSNHIRANNVDQFSRWSIGLEQNTLPVELSAFSAVQSVSNTAFINWTTQSESEVLGFYILRNTVENTASASTISSLITAHNTSVVQNYSYEDTEVEPNIPYYYWLHEVDYTGHSHYFGPATLTINGHHDNDMPPASTSTGIRTVYPNPTENNVFINYYLNKDQYIEIGVYNIKGQKISSLCKAYQLQGNNTITWDISADGKERLANGIYYVRLMVEGRVVSNRKIIILK